MSCGVGAGVYDCLCDWGYGDVVKSVNFGSKPLEPPSLDESDRPKGGPLNRRAEMWMKSKEWLEEPGGEIGLVRLTTVLAHSSGEWVSSEWPVCPVADDDR